MARGTIYIDDIIGMRRMDNVVVGERNLHYN